MNQSEGMLEYDRERHKLAFMDGSSEPESRRGKDRGAQNILSESHELDISMGKKRISNARRDQADTIFRGCGSEQYRPDIFPSFVLIHVPLLKSVIFLLLSMEVVVNPWESEKRASSGHSLSR
jgi:hypothetical protein